MDYIQNTLLKKIRRAEQRQPVSYSTVFYLYRVLIEYDLNLLFVCLWDKNSDRLSREQKGDIIIHLQIPQLGYLKGAILLLVKNDPEFFGENADRKNNSPKTLEKIISEFTSLRNDCIGHTYAVPGQDEKSFYESKVQKLKKLYRDLQNLQLPLLAKECQFYYRTSPSGSEIVVFDRQDFEYRNLSEQMAADAGLSEECTLCYLAGTEYYRLSPYFAVQEKEDTDYDFYIFRKYNLKNNVFEYNNVSNSHGETKWQKAYPNYFQSGQQVSRYTVCKANGVLSNKFNNNYEHFISIAPITDYVFQVWTFISQNRSNTCLTIRGAGGVGKTAMVQYVCTKYIFEPFVNNTVFQYVIFASAKDRELTQKRNLAGTIQKVEGEGVIHTYDDFLRITADVLGMEQTADLFQNGETIENELIEKKGVLLIIDDFETLPESEQKRFVRLISKLQIDCHKVIITTRSQYMVGEEYYIAELTEDQTIRFMTEIFETESTGTLKTERQQFLDFVKKPGNKELIYRLTEGLPLLALQLGRLLSLKKFERLELPEKWNDDVEEFLLGRLYSYFSTDSSKLLFLVLAQYAFCGRTEIPERDLRPFYDLYCAYFGLLNVDFKMDLRELEKMKILFQDVDRVQICNHISGRVLRRCKDQFIQEYKEKSQIFDERLIHLSCDLGIESGVLKYAENYSEYCRFAFVKLFTLENVLHYTNGQRFRIIASYVEQNVTSGGNDFLRDLLQESQAYFVMEDAFHDFFVKLCLKYNYIPPELEDWAENKGSDQSPELLLWNIQSEFQNILDQIDEYLAELGGVAPAGVLEEKTEAIQQKIGIVCNDLIPKYCDCDYPGTPEQRDDILYYIEEISRTHKFNILDNESIIKLKKKFQV